MLGIYGLNDAFRDPSGQRASVSLHQEYDDPAELLQPEAGKRYLLLSYSYGDSEWSLRRNVADWVFMETNVQLDLGPGYLRDLIRYDQRKNQSQHWYHTAGDAAEEPVNLPRTTDLQRSCHRHRGHERRSGRLRLVQLCRRCAQGHREIMVEDPQQPGNWHPETVDYTSITCPASRSCPTASPPRRS